MYLNDYDIFHWFPEFSLNIKVVDNKILNTFCFGSSSRFGPDRGLNGHALLLVSLAGEMMTQNACPLNPTPGPAGPLSAAERRIGTHAS